MDFEELALKRESCRNFSEKSVDNGLLYDVVKVASNAPSACNSQPWKVICVNGREMSLKVAKCLQHLGRNKFTSGCPAFFVVTEEQAKLAESLKDVYQSQEFAQIDVGIAVAHICLAAADKGLSTCIIGCIDHENLKKLLNISEDRRIRVVIAVGYSADRDVRKKIRRPVEEIVSFIT